MKFQYMSKYFMNVVKVPLYFRGLFFLSPCYLKFGGISDKQRMISLTRSLKRQLRKPMK